MVIVKPILFASADLDPQFDALATGNESGDFDGNGDVDGRDFLVWQRSGATADADILGGEPTFAVGPGVFPIDGTNGNDDLEGTDYGDIIRGHGGHDDILGGLGADNIDGGDGNDWIEGEHGNDYIEGGDGNDSLWGDEAPAENGWDGNDVLSGGDGNDNLYGQGGDDMLIGGAGTNTYTGGGGDDLLIGSQSGDRMYGGFGADRFADIGAGASGISVYDYSFGEGDLVDGASYAVVNGSTEVYDAGGNLKFLLFNYDADSQGIAFFDYTLEPAG